MSSPARDPQFSQFVEFIVNPPHAKDLMTALISRVERVTRCCPGLISARVHTNEGGDRLLMQLLWSSRKHGEQAVERSQTLEPDLFQLAQQHHARAMLFSTFNAVVEVCALPGIVGVEQ